MSKEQEQNIVTFKRVVEEVYNRGNYSAISEHFIPDFTEHQFGLHATYAGIKSDIEGIRRSFPDFHLTFEEVVAVEDRVWARMTARGTNLGGFMGPPNGKSVTITVFDEVRFKDGKIVEHWGSPDRFAVLAQLGLLPVPVVMP
jgi:predicted ester cyclase